jgi:hypothetical protein
LVNSPHPLNLGNKWAGISVYVFARPAWPNHKLYERENQTMNAHKSSRYLCGLLAAIILLLSACQPAVLPTSAQPTQPPAQPTATQPPAATQTPVQPTQPPAGASGDITLDSTGVARSMNVEIVAAVPASADGQWYEVLPQYRRLTLQGYPVANREGKPQIFVYPADGLTTANVYAGKMVADLQALLKTQKAGDQLPFMPMPFSSRQAMDAQVQYMDFKSGKGVRFLTQFNNGLAPINNSQLIYAFQGLTSDGKYYIAAVLPVTHPELPVDSTTNWQGKVGKEYQDYLSSTVSLLNQQPAGSFTADLSKLDAMIRSIEIK